MVFGRRAKGAIVGMVFGFLLVPGSIALHAWNEYRTIHRTHGITQAEEVVVSIEDIDTIPPDMESALVHVAGPAETDAILKDEEFGIRENAIHLARQVEMFQWKESREKRGDTTEYDYDLGWHRGRINSASFHKSHSHQNPELQFAELQSTAKEVKLGAYDLNAELKREIDNWQDIELNEASILETAGQENPTQFSVVENRVYWSNTTPNVSDPQVGDVRIAFKMVPPGPVSVMAMQKGNTFDEFKTRNGEPIHRLYTGLLTAAEFIERLRLENTVMAWGLRLLGAALCVGGISLILGPLHALVSWIPILGDLTGGIIFVVSLLLGLAISLVTISIAWIAVRPLLGIALLTLAGIALFAVFKLRQSVKEEPPVIDAGMLV